MCILNNFLNYLKHYQRQNNLTTQKVANNSFEEEVELTEDQMSIKERLFDYDMSGYSKEDILFMDFKNFTIDEKKVGIGQITTFDISEIENEKEEYVELINQIAENSDYYALALFATDIIKNGSYIYYNEQAKEVFANSFDIDDLKEGSYIDGCVSRKKQFIPSIINTIEKK